MKKPKLKWTKKLPTVDGFYWWRYGPSDEAPNRILIENRFVIAIGVGQPEVVDSALLSDAKKNWGGEWYGPIPSEEPR